MTTCPHTGIAVPECSCRACIQALIERHMPQAVAAPVIEPDPAATAIVTAPSRRRDRIRALGRVRLRRSA
jgi:hypothetical protein